MDEIPECRQRTEYKMSELLMACIAMFIFKEGSRNAMNNSRKEEKFKKNYEKVFKLRLPQMDAVEDVLRILNENEIERLKIVLIDSLLQHKVLHKFRLFGKYFMIAVDGTGISGSGEDCLVKEFSSGKVCKYYCVLEAKLITSNGFSISVCSEWVTNEGLGKFDKQDCEQKAFKRLSAKLKLYFPRLPICILADGLYPNEPFFKICQMNDWRFIVTLKEGNLKSVQEEIKLLPKLPETVIVQATKNTRITKMFKWANDIDYRGFSLYWVECIEKVVTIKTGQEDETCFAHITDIEIDSKNVQMINFSGRLRWKIENEGFNIQKNHGYELEHGYSRASLNALKHYYQCLQIGHLINQLVIHSLTLQEMLKADSKLTIIHLWKALMGYMIYAEIPSEFLDEHIKKRYQFRLA